MKLSEARAELTLQHLQGFLALRDWERGGWFLGAVALYGREMCEVQLLDLSHKELQFHLESFDVGVHVADEIPFALEL